jgi:transcription initiation factor IIE alpha subunit
MVCPQCKEDVKYLDKTYLIHGSASERVELSGDGECVTWDDFEVDEITETYDVDYLCPNCGYYFKNFKNDYDKELIEFLKSERKESEKW